MLRLFIALSFLSLLPSQGETVIFREDFREVKPHVPVSTADLTMSPFLSLSRHGEGAENYKLSFHPEKPNDPHYVWNGLTGGKTALAFQFAHTLDLSAADSKVKLSTRNSATSHMHVALKTRKGWMVNKNGIGRSDSWKVDTIKLHQATWLKLEMGSLGFGEVVTKPSLAAVTALAFVNPQKPTKSKSCSRLDWFSLHSSSAKIQAEHQVTAAPFWEDSQPFLRTALVVEQKNKQNRTRRGVVLRLGHDLYACFDPDLMRYSAIWEAANGKSPITLDSMAGTSYPDRNTKSKRPPQLLGSIISSSPELAGVGTGDSLFGDPREGVSNSAGEKLGRMPRKLARWVGISLKDGNPVLHYQISETKIQESIRAVDSGTIVRVIEVGPSDECILISTGEKAALFPHLSVSGSSEYKLIPDKKRGSLLELKPQNKKRIVRIILSKKLTSSEAGNQSFFLTDPLMKSMEITSLHAQKAFPIKVRNITVPHDNPSRRPIRLTDIGFLSNGNALITTLDGDVWRVEDIDKETATWARVASGLYEPMSLSITSKDKIFVLGRDQVTELVDTDNDGVFDFYKCASDAFIQTLHTRDFSTSLIVEPNGDFIISKGGIRKVPVKNKDECSLHRGAVLRLPAGGGDAVVLADGLRIPFIGRDGKGQIFASDQQGRFTPSTPIYKLDATIPSFGFDPTNHRKRAHKQPALWFPYASNRSAADFTILSKQRFPDFPDQFTNLSWNGRLFALKGMNQESPFSVRLPVQLDYPILNAATHPKNGKLYGVGLGISGYKPDTAKIMGLCEVEQVSPIPNPQTIDVEKNKITLTFSKPIDPEIKLMLPASEIKAWNIKRTAKYGSGHFRWDGRPGEHGIDYAASLSDDRKQITFITADLFQSSILRLILSVKYKDVIFLLEISTNPIHLKKPGAKELAGLSKPEKEQKLFKGDVAKGKLHFKKYACATCHSVKNLKLNGPALNGISKRHDTAFILESILKPEKVITKGYEASMPSFEGVINAQDLEDIIAYIKSLK
ncbi:MAG: cytochrome c2 [Cryomorphaceae bacterium]|jgi:cytochrome c2